MQRSVNILYPLESHDEQADKSMGDSIISQDAGHSEDISVRSVRPPAIQTVINYKMQD